MTRYSKRIGFYKVKCVRCGKEFSTIRYDLAKYCSYRCQYIAFNKRRKKRIEKARIKKCVVCGTVFQAKRKDALYCSNKCKQKKYRENVTNASCGKFSSTCKSNKIERMIIEHNKRESRKVLQKAIKSRDSKEHLFSKRMVDFKLKSFNCSPEELIERQKQGNLYMTVAECKECFKMIESNQQIKLEGSE